MSFGPQGSFPGPHPCACRLACALRAGAPAAALGWSLAPGRPSRAATLHPAQAGGTAHVLTRPQQPLWRPVARAILQGAAALPRGCQRRNSSVTKPTQPAGSGKVRPVQQLDGTLLHRQKWASSPRVSMCQKGQCREGPQGCSSPSLFTSGTRPPPHPSPCVPLPPANTWPHTHTHTHTIQTVNVEKINGCAKNRTEPASSPNLRNAK